MPHVIYLHSALTQNRIVGASWDDRKRIYRFEVVDVIIAMGLAGLVNASMLITAAAVFHTRGMDDLGDDLEAVHAGLSAIIGSHAGTLFGLALLASGLASSSVGTMAGQIVMQGFIHRTIPLAIRRGVTMAPALIVLAIGTDPTRALVISQVVLSFGIPFALVPLLLVCRDRNVMGPLVNQRSTTIVATAVAVVIICLNVFLLEQTFFG
jgi:manganese transport protein